MQEKKVTKVEVKAKPTTKKQPVKKTKVAAYARVSTVKDAQEHSLKSQRAYYTKYIKSHTDWIFAGIYTDDGISGLSMRNRDGFNRLIADALEGKIDLILTKSLSRFARNTVDSLTTIRKLKAVGVAIYFEKENINTLDANGEFLITLMSSFAEEESRSISENITWSVRRRFAQGIYHLFNNYGYKHPKGKDAYIVEDEAKVVRFIYMLALTGKSGNYIAEILNGYGIPSPLNATWQGCVVLQILTNPKYMGDAILQRTYTVDFLTKKVKVNEGEVPQYYVENGHPAIVSKKVWNSIQPTILDNKYTNDTSPPLARRIICGDCYGAYGPKLWHSTTYRDKVWQCNNRIAGRTKCKCPHLYFKQLDTAMGVALRHLFSLYPSVIADCKSLIERQNVPNQPQINTILERLTTHPERITFDNLALSVLIPKIIVTSKHNLNFYFIDGNTLRYRLQDLTPKSRPSFYERNKRKKAILDLHYKGVPASKIAKQLKISINSVRALLCRHKLKNK